MRSPVAAAKGVLSLPPATTNPLVRKLRRSLLGVCVLAATAALSPAAAQDPRFTLGAAGGIATIRDASTSAVVGVGGTARIWRRFALNLATRFRPFTDSGEVRRSASLDLGVQADMPVSRLDIFAGIGGGWLRRFGAYEEPGRVRPTSFGFVGMSYPAQGAMNVFLEARVRRWSSFQLTDRSDRVANEVSVGIAVDLKRRR
jgi:hypothetical protein